MYKLTKSNEYSNKCSVLNSFQLIFSSFIFFKFYSTFYSKFANNSNKFNQIQINILFFFSMNSLHSTGYSQFFFGVFLNYIYSTHTFTKVIYSTEFSQIKLLKYIFLKINNILIHLKSEFSYNRLHNILSNEFSRNKFSGTNRFY